MLKIFLSSLIIYAATANIFSSFNLLHHEQLLSIYVAKIIQLFRFAHSYAITRQCTTAITQEQQVLQVIQANTVLLKLPLPKNITIISNTFTKQENIIISPIGTTMQYGHMHIAINNTNMQQTLIFNQHLRLRSVVTTNKKSYSS